MKRAIDQIKEGVDTLRESPRITAEMTFKSALDYMHVEAYEDAIERFKQVESLAMNALSMNESFELNAFSSRLLVFSQLMQITFDKEKEIFQPFEKLERKKKKLCCLKIENICNKLSSDIPRRRTRRIKPSDQDSLDSVLTAVYPILSICSEMTSPTQNLSNIPEIVFEIQPKYLPYEENDATTLPIGIFLREKEIDKDIIVFIWLDGNTGFTNIRLACRVFQIPKISSDKIKIHLKTDGLFYRCFYSSEKDDYPIQCKHNQIPPKGVKDIDALIADLKRDGTWVPRELFKEMKRLGSHYLKAVKIDIDAENSTGENLLDVVALYGTSEMLTSLLDAGMTLS